MNADQLKRLGTLLEDLQDILSGAGARPADDWMIEIGNGHGGDSLVTISYDNEDDHDPSSWYLTTKPSD